MMMPLAIAAADDDCSFLTGAMGRAFSGKLAGIQLLSNEDATDKETIRNYFSKTEGQPSILEKQPPLP